MDMPGESLSTDTSGESDSDELIGAIGDDPSNKRQVAHQIVKDAVAMAIGNLFEYLPFLCVMMFVGHLSNADKELAGLNLGRSFFNGCWNVAYGFTTALHTLAPQAEGAGMPALRKVYTQRAFVIVMVVCLPLALMQSVSGSLMRLLGEDPDITVRAELFAVRCIPRLFAEGAFTILQRVGQAMGYALEITALTGVSFASSVLFLWLFVFTAGLRYLGAAWASSAWNITQLGLIIVVLARKDGGRELFIPHSPFREVLSWQGCVDYCKLAVPATLQVCFESWAINLGVAMLVGLLPNPDVSIATNAILDCIQGVCAMMWAGMAGAVAIAVGKQVGAGDAAAARQAAGLGLLVGGCLSATAAIFLCLLRFQIPALIIHSEEVIVEAASCLRVTAIVVFFDGVNATIYGILRGMGRQARAAQSQFVGFYVVGAPVVAVMFWSFRHTAWGLVSLWVAVACAIVTSFLCSAIYLIRADWSSVLEEASMRNQSMRDE